MIASIEGKVVPLVEQKKVTIYCLGEYSRDVFLFGEVKEIRFGNQTLLYREVSHKASKKLFYSLVLGYKASEPYYSAPGISALKVLFITQDEGKNAEEYLLDRLPGPILFLALSKK